MLPSSLPPDVDLETVYPSGDSHIAPDPLGSLLLLVDSYSRDEKKFQHLMKHHPPKELLSTHMELIAVHRDGSSLNAVDATIFLGLHMVQSLTQDDIPSLSDPTTPPATVFLTYLQRLGAMAATCHSDLLRPMIYNLVEAILTVLPDPAKLYYLVDTIQHCPFMNLRAAAVGTLKKQIAQAKQV